MFQGQIARTFRLGVKNLLLHPLRSLLTTLGILIGVAAVIWMLAIAEGASWEAQQKIKALGSNNILVQSRKPPDLDQQSSSFFSVSSYGLKYADADAIAATLPAVRVVVPVRAVPKAVRNGDRSMTATLYGTDPRYPEVAGLTVDEGRFLTRLDLEQTRNVAVLGAGLAKELYPLESPVGKPLRVGTESFRVVGVLADTGGSGNDASSSISASGVLVPLTAQRSWFGELTVKQSQGSREMELVQLHEIAVQIQGEGEELESNVLGTAAALRALMKKLHTKVDYEIQVPLEQLYVAKEQARIWQFVLGFIASMSLVVAGIGIMNVMLATVTERTREIGIRRALGAKRRHIVAQFLVETVVLSCAGGLAGVVLGVLGPGVVEWLLDKKTIVEPVFAVLAFTVSAGIGIVFGLYPAWRAAQMDPVEALRHE